MNKKLNFRILLIILIFIPIITKAEENNFKVGNNTYSSIEEAIIDATTSKKELLFLKDIELKKITINETQNVILNLNGYNLNCDPNDLVPLCILNKGKLKIKGENSTITASENFIRNAEGADLTIESGIYNFKTTNMTSPIKNSGNLTINGGTFEFENNLYGIKIDGLNSTNTIISNGTFNFKNTSCLIHFMDDGELTILGGNFNGDNQFVNSSLNLSNSGDKFNRISILGGTFDYIGDKTIGNMFSFYGSQDHNNTIINIANINIIEENIGIISGAWINLNITNSTLISNERVVFTTGGITTIGNNDNNIENTPIITSKSSIAIHSTSTINFYDGLITSTSTTPLGDDLNTLPSYNVINNNNGTYTARLTKDTNDEEVDEDINNDNINEKNEEEIKENAKEENIIENPKTGNRKIYLVFITLIITIFIITFNVKINKIK